MRYFLLACVLLFGMGSVGCDQSPQDAAWSKAVTAIEEVAAAGDDLKNSNKPLTEITQRIRSGAQQLQAASNDLSALSISKEQKRAPENRYKTRLEALSKVRDFSPLGGLNPTRGGPSDALQMMSAAVEFGEALIAWMEAAGVATPEQIAQQRAQFGQMRSMTQMAGGAMGGATMPPNNRMPGATPGMPGGFSLPPGGPGGVNTAPATAMASSLPALPPLPTASTGVGLPSLPNTTPTIGATATLPPLPGTTPAAAGATATLPPLGGASNPMGSLPPTPGMPGTSGPMTDLSSMQKKSQVLTSPEHQTILKDFASAGADLIGSFKQATNKKGAVFAKGQCNRTCDKIKALAKKLDKLPPMSESDATIFHRSYDEMSDALSSAVNNASQLVRTQYPPLTVTINTIAVDLRKALDIMSESVNGAEGKAIATVDQERKDSSNSSQEESKPQPVPGVTPASTEPQENNPDAFGKEE